MYHNYEGNQGQSSQIGDSKSSINKLAKSQTLFHTKKNIMNKATFSKTVKKSSPNKTDKITKKVYFSSQKKNKLENNINPKSPHSNNKFKEINGPKTIRPTNIPNSAQRIYKYKNGYILNNINNYQTNIIINSNRKENKYSSINGDNLNIDKEINKKSNGTPNVNNSLINSSENFMKTIAITLSNNNENSFPYNYIGINGFNGGKIKNKNKKNMNNINNFTSFHSNGKISQKSKEKYGQICKTKKELFSKNTEVKIPKKLKSNMKINTDISKNSKILPSKKINSCSSVNNSNKNSEAKHFVKDENINLDDQFNDNIDKNENIEKDFMDKNTYSYKEINNINEEGIVFQDNNNFNENVFLDDDYNTLNKDFKNNKLNNQDDDKNLEIQTYNGLFKKNIIKVNTIEKEGKNKSSNKIKYPMMNSNINESSPLNKNLINNFECNTFQIKNNLNNIISPKHISFNDVISEINNNNRNSANKLNLNISPLNKENSHAYVKKKSSSSRINSSNNNQVNNGNPLLLSNQFKNNSISSNIYSTHRSSEKDKISTYIKNKNQKNEYFKNKSVGKISEKSILVPEYSIKLENLKSRVSNLLNVYSLLALRSLNITNDRNNENNNFEQ